jgi:bifunctional DNA-binding transcriptional regulator/antitoxin component of YhaV-PrlF toxin-antitoxin module
MIEIHARISSTNQRTLPAEARRHLGVRAPDAIAFVLADGGTVELRPVRFGLESIIGSVEPLPSETSDLEREIAQATAEEITRRSQYQS